MLRYKQLLMVLSIYLLLVVVGIIYFFGVTGPLLLDDFPNLEPLGHYGGVVDFESALRFIFSNGSGPLGRPVAMASFLINDSAWPIGNVASFKLTNIAFHLCAGLVIFLLVNRLLRQEFRVLRKNSELFALAVMAIWLLHPIHASTVFYVIQRMTILSAFFSLVAFFCYLQLRYSCKEQKPFYAFLSIVFGIVFFLLAIFSKENALLVLPFIVICELFIFRSLLSNKIKHVGRYITYAVFLTSPIWLYMTYDFWGQGYAFRDYTLSERLILQIAVVGDYICKLFLPSVSSFNLFDERFTSSAISITNFAFIKGLIFTLVLLVLFIYSTYKKVRLLVFGLVWFIFFHLMESSFLPLEVYFEHRNYLPSVGLFIVIVGLLDCLRKKSSSVVIPASSLVLYLIYLCFSCFILSKTWGDPSSLFIKFAGDEPTSVRAKVTYAAYLEGLNLPEFAIVEIEEAMVIRPEMLSLALNKLRIACEHGLNIDDGHIEKLRKAYFFETAALLQFKRLIAIDPDYCPILSDNPHLIEDLMESVPDMEGYGSRHRAMAQFYYSKTDYFVNKGMFNQAMDALEIAIEYTPTVDLFLRKTVLLTSAGLYDEALKVIPFAVEADNNRRYLIPSRIKEIQFVQHSLRNTLKGNVSVNN